MGIKTIQYHDPESGLDFEITANFPMMGKDKAAKEYAQPIVDSIKKVDNSIYTLESIKQRIDAFNFDFVTMFGARNAGFQFANCKIDASGGAATIQLDVTDPDGNKDTLKTEAGNILYKNLVGRIDAAGMLNRVVIGSPITLPFKQILSNAYFLPKELDMVSRNESGLTLIIKKAVDENPFWAKSTAPLAEVFAIDYTDRSLRANALTCMDIGNLVAGKQRPLPNPLHDLGAKAAILTAADMDGYTVFTERAVEIYRLPGKEVRYGIFSQQGFPGPRNGRELVAVTDGGEVEYNPVIGIDNAKTRNNSYIILPLLLDTKDKEEAMTYAGLLNTFIQSKADTLIPIKLTLQLDQGTGEVRIIVGIKPDITMGADIPYSLAQKKVAEIIEYVKGNDHLHPSPINVQGK